MTQAEIPLRAECVAAFRSDAAISNALPASPMAILSMPFLSYVSYLFTASRVVLFGLRLSCHPECRVLLQLKPEFHNGTHEDIAGCLFVDAENCRNCIQLQSEGLF